MKPPFIQELFGVPHVVIGGTAIRQDEVVGYHWAEPPPGAPPQMKPRVVILHKTGTAMTSCDDREAFEKWLGQESTPKDHEEKTPGRVIGPSGRIVTPEDLTAGR